MGKFEGQRDPIVTEANEIIAGAKRGLEAAVGEAIGYFEDVTGMRVESIDLIHAETIGERVAKVRAVKAGISFGK